MIVEDLEHIFKPQSDEGTTNLYFMVFDTPDHAEILRHPAGKLNELLPLLDSFQYAGTITGMPRFTKELSC
jgi:hypothetical protein